MSSVASGDGTSMAPADYVFEGDITGNADWTIAPTTDIQWRLTVDGKDIRVLQATKAPVTPVAPGQLISTNNQAKRSFEPLWDEHLPKQQSRANTI